MTNHPRSPRHRLSCWWNNICPLHGEVHYGSHDGFPDKYLKCSGCRATASCSEVVERHELDELIAHLAHGHTVFFKQQVGAAFADGEEPLTEEFFKHALYLAHKTQAPANWRQVQLTKAWQKRAEEAETHLHEWRERRVQELEKCLREIALALKVGQGVGVAESCRLYAENTLAKSDEWREQIRKGARHE